METLCFHWPVSHRGIIEKEVTSVGSTDAAVRAVLGECRAVLRNRELQPSISFSNPANRKRLLSTHTHEHDELSENSLSSSLSPASTH